MQARQIAVMTFIGVVLVAALLYSQNGRRSGKTQITGQPQAAGDARAPAAIDAQASGPAAAAGEATALEKAKPMALAKGSFKYRAELEQFTHLKNKVFSSDDDKAQRARLISDRDLLKGLEPLLLTPAKTGSDLEILQNEALDLLFEAQETASAEVANQVLRAVIADASVEDTKLDMDARRSLGGVKAEVLFNWSARDPRIVADLRAWLPGPVSGRIWENVQQAQRRNRMESSAEIE